MTIKFGQGIAEAKDEKSQSCPVCGHNGCIVGCTVEFKETPAVPVCRCGICGYIWLLRDRSNTADITHEMTSRSYSTSVGWVVSRLPADIRNRRDVRVLDISCWDGYLLGGLSWDGFYRKSIHPTVSGDIHGFMPGVGCGARPGCPVRYSPAAKPFPISHQEVRFGALAKVDK